MKKTIATALSTLILALFLVPSASADYPASDFGVAAAPEGSALPGPSSFWAGTCDLDSPLAEVGAAPSLAPHCIDQGNVTTGSPAWFPPPSWRLAATTQAGSHPEGSATFTVDRPWTRPGGASTKPFEASLVNGAVDNIYVGLPPGFVGDPNAVPKCTAEQFAVRPNQCPPETQVGIASIVTRDEIFSFPVNVIYPVYNLEPRDGRVAEFGIPDVASFVSVRVQAKVRDNGDYGVDTFASQIPAALDLFTQELTIWGVPWAASHDPWRVTGFQFTRDGVSSHTIPANGLLPADQTPYQPGWGPIKPFISNIGECDGAEQTNLRTDEYVNPGAFTADGDPDTGDADWRTYTSAAPAVEECGVLPFDPGISLDPSAKAADSPTALDVELTIPQNDDPPAGVATDPSEVTGAPAFWGSDAGRATSQLKDTVVTLPEGMALNPAAADGLAVCSTEQIGYEGADERQILVLPQGGGVTLTFAGQSTAPIPAGASAASVDAALEALPNVGPGGVAVSGNPGGPWQVEFTGPLAGVDVPQITGLATNDEIQNLVVPSGAGTYTLTFNGQTTAPISFAADATTIQGELEALSNVEPGDIVVDAGATIGGSTNYVFAFGGGLAASDVPQLIAASSGNTKVFTPVQGAMAVVATTDHIGAMQRFDSSDPSDGQGLDCPDAAKVGEVTVETPVLEEADWPTGQVYLAAQGDNPFASDFAIYIVVRSPERGLLVKLAGKVEPDPATGRLRTTFAENPQLPFDRFELRFKGGPRAPLATPTTCGTHTSTTQLTPWSAAHNAGGLTDTVNDPFQVDSSPAGGCPTTLAQRPLNPGFSAGSTQLVAGAFSPFTVRITRPDGNQELDRVEVTTPEGLAAKLAGVPYCPEAGVAQAIGRTARGDGAKEQADPSCPAASQVGTTTVGAGAGNQPIFVKGNVYLAGPYQGAPVSLAFVVPAVAGPFDLGVQVVRTALNVNPKTAQVTASSDSIPKLLRGIPLRIRDIRVDIDRPGFTINPTDCSEQLVTGTVKGASGATTQVSNRFQIAECARLPFKPRLQLRLKGGTNRTGNPKLIATLNARPGDANIAFTQVTMPKSEFLDNEHIRTICTRVQFAADTCPKGSIYGFAEAISPLLDEPLRGNVYLRSSDNTLPDLIADLRGPDHQPIRVELSGRTDSFKKALRNTFEVVPDAPVSKFTLTLFGGNRGLLVNSQNICRGTHRATVRMEAQNGRELTLRPKLLNDCRKSKKRKRNGKRSR